MPNHVINEIIFRNVSRDVQEDILKKVLKDGFIDFNVLVPVPLNIWQGNIGMEGKEIFGRKNWHDWNRENWGTKWNAYGKYGEANERKNIIQTEDTLTVVFQTAWSPPRIWLCALFNATGLPLEYNYLSEGDANARAAKLFFNDADDPSPEWEEKEIEDKGFNGRLKDLLYG